MPTKRTNLKLIIAALVLIVAGLLAFRFLMPANCSALLQDAQYVVINVVENTAEDGMPETDVYELNLEPGDRELIELKNLFAEYNCFYTTKKADGFVFEIIDYSIYFNATDGTKPTGAFSTAGKYIFSGGNVWTVGLFGSKAEDFQLRLYEFVMEHQEAIDE